MCNKQCVYTRLSKHPRYLSVRPHEQCVYYICWIHIQHRMQQGKHLLYSLILFIAIAIASYKFMLHRVLSSPPASLPEYARLLSWETVKHVLPIVPSLDSTSAHKGQHGNRRLLSPDACVDAILYLYTGRILIVGGSESYTGAPYYAGMVILFNIV